MNAYATASVRRGLRPALLAAALLLPLGACDIDRLLNVDDRDVISQPVYLDPENLPSVYGGAIREFSRAYAGEYNGEGGIILHSGTFADELFSSDNFSDRNQIDARNMTPVNDANETAFFWLQRARNHAEVAVGLLEAGADEENDWSEERAELLALAGFTYVMFGENYCGGVPFSDTSQEGQTTYGAAETTAQIFARAVSRFDASLALAPSADVENLARIGKARALLNTATTPAEVSAAAAIVAAVPTEFAYEVGYSASITLYANAVWQLVNAEKRWSVADVEGGTGLPYVSDGDPRTPTEENEGGGFSSAEHWSQLKYPAQGTDIPLATGIEARLIEAEAELRSGDYPGALLILNNLRQNFGPGGTALTPLAAAATPAAQVDQLFKERAYWMWLTSHRLGDLRRLIRQYGRTEAQVYPQGPTEQGLTRGTQVSLVVPFAEQNNPEYDPAACNNSVP